MEVLGLLVAVWSAVYNMAPKLDLHQHWLVPAPTILLLLLRNLQLLFLLLHLILLPVLILLLLLIFHIFL